MIETEINIAIAMECGYQKKRDGYWFSPKSNQGVLLPGFYHDLNAMNEAEAILSVSERHEYTKWLGDNWMEGGTLIWTICNATATQRAKAFLRVKGLWKENA